MIFLSQSPEKQRVIEEQKASEKAEYLYYDPCKLSVWQINSRFIFVASRQGEII